MSAIAKWSVAGTLALAKEIGSGFFNFERFRRELSSAMATIAERLFLGSAAGTEEVGFPSLKIRFRRIVSRYFG